MIEQWISSVAFLRSVHVYFIQTLVGMATSTFRFSASLCLAMMGCWSVADVRTGVCTNRCQWQWQRVTSVLLLQEDVDRAPGRGQGGSAGQFWCKGWQQCGEVEWCDWEAWWRCEEWQQEHYRWQVINWRDKYFNIASMKLLFPSLFGYILHVIFVLEAVQVCQLISNPGKAASPPECISQYTPYWTIVAQINCCRCSRYAILILKGVKQLCTIDSKAQNVVLCSVWEEQWAILVKLTSLPLFVVFM